MAAKDDRYYRKNREKILARQAVRRRWLNRQKNKPCHDCGKKYHSCAMQFDHMPGTVKRFNIANGVNYTRAILKAELAKCQLVCAVCHAIRTYRRRRAR